MKNNLLLRFFFYDFRSALLGETKSKTIFADKRWFRSENIALSWFAFAMSDLFFCCEGFALPWAICFCYMSVCFCLSDLLLLWATCFCREQFAFARSEWFALAVSDLLLPCLSDLLLSWAICFCPEWATCFCREQFAFALSEWICFGREYWFAFALSESFALAMSEFAVAVSDLLLLWCCERFAFAVTVDKFLWQKRKLNQSHQTGLQNFGASFQFSPTEEWKLTSTMC